MTKPAWPVRLLEIGRDASQQIPHNDLHTQIKNEYPELNSRTIDEAINTSFQNVQPPDNSSTGKGAHRQLTMDGFFRFLEYTELQEARASSLLAFRMSFFALLVSAGLAITSIYFQVSGVSKVSVQSIEVSKADWYRALQDRHIRAFTD